MANAMEARLRNILAVVEAVHRQPGIDKPALCRQCGLAPSTVQGIVGRLAELGVLGVTGMSDSTGGRRAQRYSINPTHRYVLGVRVGLGGAELGVLDMGLTLLHRRSLPLSLAQTGPESYIGTLAAEAQALLRDSGLPVELFCGAGISVPGPTDFAAGAVREISGAPQWRNFPMGSRLRAALDMPVWVDKDAYMGMQYLDYTGAVSRDRTALYLTIGEGIGAGLMLHGRIYRGSHGIAGEVGHVTVRRDGVRCQCGNIGCLELYCSDTGLLSQYNAQSGTRCPTLEDLISWSQAGDETARRVFVQAVRYLVDATTGLIMNYDPDQIFIHCRWLDEQRQLYFSLLDGMYAKSIFTQRHTADIRLLEPRDVRLQAAGSVAAAGYLLSPHSPHIRALDQ